MNGVTKPQDESNLKQRPLNTIPGESSTAVVFVWIVVLTIGGSVEPAGWLGWRLQLHQLTGTGHPQQAVVHVEHPPRRVTAHLCEGRADGSPLTPVCVWGGGGAQTQWGDSGG